jgi:sugar lactone lactonase YvrE
MVPARVAGLILAFPLLAHATKPQHAVWKSYGDLAAGKCVSTSLTDDGVLAPAPVTDMLADLGEEEAWSVVALPNGAWLVGTAPEGKLLKVAADGTVSQMAKFDESHIYALAAGPKGEVYAGTSPDGKVYRISSDGKTEVWFDPKEKYIWSLVVAPDGTLYVGTGTRGRIYRVTGKGEGELWYASNETHIRALALDKAGALLAGSASSGCLYRIPAKDQAVVLAGTGREEINQIHVAADGTIYFTATGTSKSDDSSGLKKPDADSPAPGGAGKDAVSALYRLDATLYPEIIWPTKETILAMTGNDTQTLVGMGSNGYAYAVSPHGEATRLCKIDSDSVTAMAARGGDVILATSNPARLFRVGQKTSAPGTYETDVVDSQSFARWGAVNIDASNPGAVKIMTRSGNTSKPDKTWYPWTEALQGVAQSPASRYFQVQLQIDSGTVDRIDAVYLPKNQAPHIDAVTLLPVGVGYTPAPSTPLPPLPQTAAQIFLGDNGPDSSSAMRYAATSAHGLRTAVWKASDPNGDALTYAIFWRKQGETGWHELTRDLNDSIFTWDTSSWTDGRYELKIEASDADANAPGEGLTDSVISRAIVVNNTPPVIKILPEKNGTVEFSVSDSLSPLQSVTVSDDGKSYHELPPVDGILDSALETFHAPKTPGQILFIRAQDAGGNIAGAQTDR